MTPQNEHIASMSLWTIPLDCVKIPISALSHRFLSATFAATGIGRLAGNIGQRRAECERLKLRGLGKRMHFVGAGNALAMPPWSLQVLNSSNCASTCSVKEHNLRRKGIPRACEHQNRRRRTRGMNCVGRALCIWTVLVSQSAVLKPLGWPVQSEDTTQTTWC